jgi:subtilisin-like proprotein convertase family protein
MTQHALNPGGIRRIVNAAAAAGIGFAAHAAILNFEVNGLNLPIPDANSSGVGDTRVLPAAPGPILDINVTLKIRPRNGSQVYNGDLYAALSHESGYAVLLNRVGRRSGSSLGYGDNGLDVGFDDEAANGDVHQYRLTLGGSHSTALASGPPALTGAWAPDARFVPPANSWLEDEFTRTAMLSNFDGLAVAGDWTLLVVDWETGGLATLDSWGLQITVVPEPSAASIATAAGLASLAGIRIWRRRASPANPVP